LFPGPPEVAEPLQRMAEGLGKVLALHLDVAR
jgi:hypothetical protein